MSERIALYPGSFDPPTNGHRDLIERARKMFDKLIVAVAVNEEKSCLFTIDERVAMLKDETKDMDKVEVTSFKGLTAYKAKECGAIAIVRGLRAVSDFEYEIMMATTNRKLNPDVDTVCLMPSEPSMFLNSRVVREVARLNGDVSKLVSPAVADRLRKKLNHR